MRKKRQEKKKKANGSLQGKIMQKMRGGGAKKFHEE
jgi:hypothetical protein